MEGEKMEEREIGRKEMRENDDEMEMEEKTRRGGEERSEREG